MSDSHRSDTHAAGQGPGNPGRRDYVVARVSQARLLLSSYAALNLILFARVHPSGPKFACLVLGVFGIFDGLRMARSAEDADIQPVTFSNVRDAGAEVAAYVATYLLPLIAAPNPSCGDLVAYGIYGVVIVLISVNSSLLQVNPTLYVFRRRLVTVTRQDGRQQYLICRTPPQPGIPAYVARQRGMLYEVNSDAIKSN